MQYKLKRLVENYTILREPMRERKQAKKAQPFVQWVGGKRKLLNDFDNFLPKKFNNYFEPFAGGGSLFFHIQEKHGDTKQYTLFDMNPELVITYNEIKNNWSEVQSLVNQMNQRHSKEFYYLVRNIDREQLSARKYKKTLTIAKDLQPVEVAARFLYLNITCFNAIYRVNKEGMNNVPVGKTLRKNFEGNGNLELCSSVLKRANILHKDFSEVENMAKPGDLVYLDPPYIPISQTANFTDYTEGGFDHDDQVRLRDMAQRLKDKGVYVYLSNSGAELVRELYKGWTIEEFSLKRSLGVASKEKTVSELRSEEIPELLIF